VGESSGQRFQTDARGRACQNWLNIHGGSNWRPASSSSVFDNDAEDNLVALVSESLVEQKVAAKKPLSAFDKSIKSSFSAGVYDGLKIMNEYKAVTEQRPDKNAKHTGSKDMQKPRTETSHLLKAVFDSSCGSELDLTPLKSPAKRAQSSLRKDTTDTVKRLKYNPDTHVGQVMDGPTKSLKPDAVAKNPQLKKSLFDFGRFEREEKSPSQSVCKPPKLTKNSSVETSSGKGTGTGNKSKPKESAAKQSSSNELRQSKENVKPQGQENVIGSGVFDSEPEASQDGARNYKQAAKKPNRSQRQRQEVKRRQSRTISKMAEYSQAHVLSEDESLPSSPKRRRKDPPLRSKTSVKRSGAVDKNQQRMDGFLTRSKRGKVDVNKLLRPVNLWLG
jgi:hypothetical protein